MHGQMLPRVLLLCLLVAISARLCEEYTDEELCLTDPLCGWCDSDTGKCMSGTRDGPHFPLQCSNTSWLVRWRPDWNDIIEPDEDNGISEAQWSAAVNDVHTYPDWQVQSAQACNRLRDREKSWACDLSFVRWKGGEVIYSAPYTNFTDPDPDKDYAKHINPGQDALPNQILGLNFTVERRRSVPLKCSAMYNDPVIVFPVANLHIPYVLQTTLIRIFSSLRLVDPKAAAISHKAHLLLAGRVSREDADILQRNVQSLTQRPVRLWSDVADGACFKKFYIRDLNFGFELMEERVAVVSATRSQFLREYIDSTREFYELPKPSASEPLLCLMRRSDERIISNEGELLGIAEAMGLHTAVLQFDDMSLKARVEKVGHCSMLAGVTGGTFMNAMWLPREALIIHIKPYRIRSRGGATYDLSLLLELGYQEVYTSDITHATIPWQLLDKNAPGANRTHVEALLAAMKAMETSEEKLLTYGLQRLPTAENKFFFDTFWGRQATYVPPFRFRELITHGLRTSNIVTGKQRFRLDVRQEVAFPVEEASINKVGSSPKGHHETFGSDAALYLRFNISELMRPHSEILDAAIQLTASSACDVSVGRGGRCVNTVWAVEDTAWTRKTLRKARPTSGQQVGRFGLSPVGRKEQVYADVSAYVASTKDGVISMKIQGGATAAVYLSAKAALANERPQLLLGFRDNVAKKRQHSSEL